MPTFEAVDTPFAAEGWMFEAADGLGVMTLLPPGSSAREEELAEATAPAIAALSPDGGERYERFWAWTWSMLPDEPHWLLDQLAVEPDAQGRGIGGAMIRHAIDRAEADGLPLFLETAVPGEPRPVPAARVRGLRGGRRARRRPARLVPAQGSGQAGAGT